MIKKRHQFLTAALALALAAPNAARAADDPATRPSGDQPQVIVVIGAPGTEEYGEEFSKSAERWNEAARRGGAKVTIIGREASPAVKEKQQLQDAIKSAVAASATAPLWLVLIGHGTFDGKEAKFNLRDTDIADQELATWLQPCVRPLAVLNCFSCSAPFLSKLAGPKNRVIITATRTGSEVNYSRFGNYLSAAIADPSADLDKDGQTSLLEAFLAAAHKTDEFYKSESRLATEHPLLDDNGDKLGISADWFQGIRAVGRARTPAPLDGPRAHQWCLVQSAQELSMPPDLRARRDAIELQVESLRLKKGTMSPDAYFAALDPLMLSLSKLYAGKTPPESFSRPATSPSTPPPPPSATSETAPR